MKDLNKLIISDCFNYLNGIDNNSVDLIVVDPPYFMNKGEWDTFESEDDFFNFTYKWIDKSIDKLKNGGSFYIFNTPYNSAFILTYMIKKGMKFKNWLTWDKRDGFSHTKKKFIPNQETILFFSKGDAKTFNADDVRVEYNSTERMAHAMKKGILKKDGTRWFPNENGKLCGDVWHITSERHKNKVNGKVVSLGHATPKPVEMIERIIKASSNEEDVVMDFFVGSGTTAIASKKLNRNFLCSDAKKEYIDIAKKRLKGIENKNQTTKTYSRA